MARYTHISEFVDFMGEDLRSSDILRPKGFSKGSKNCLHTPQGGVTQRFGSKLIGAGCGKFGIVRFDTTNMLGESKTEIIGFGGPTAATSYVPYRLVRGSFTLTNSHATDAATVNHYYNTSTSDFRFTIARGGSTLLDFDGGLGSEAVPVYLSALETAVDAVANFAMSTPTNASTTPAAFIEILDGETIAANGGTLTVYYHYWEEIHGTKPTFETGANAATNILDMSFGGSGAYNVFRDGDIVRFFTTNTLPGNLSTNTDYYVRDATPTGFKVSSTAGGAAVNISSTGTGRHFVQASYSNIAGLRQYADEIFGTDAYKNISTAVLNNVLYIAPMGWSDTSMMGSSLEGDFNVAVCKYDGQRFYRAGMSGSATGDFFFSIGGAAAGAQTDHKGSRTTVAYTRAACTYRAYLKQVDKAGNIVEGIASDATASSATGSGTNRLNMLVHQVMFAGLGYNTAVAVGTSSVSGSLTVPCDNGAGGDQELEAGDIAYFWDSAQERFIQREVVSSTGSQIVLSEKSLDSDPTSPNYDTGGNVSLNDEAAISANLRIVILRKNDSGASAYQVVEEIPFSWFYDDYFDTTADGALGAEYIEPAISYDPPPTGVTTLATFNGLLMAGGDPKHSKTVHFSDVESPEYFPRATHSFDLPKPLSGMRQSGDVFVVGSKRDYIGAVVGDLTNFAFRVEQLADNIGILAHDGIQQIDEANLFIPTHKGPYALTNGRDLTPLGAITYPDGSTVSRIEPFFTQLYATNAEQPIWDRMTSAVLPKMNLYLLHVPFEDPDDEGFGLSTGVTWVFDYGRGCWWPWYGWNASAGMAVLDDALIFQSRVHDGAAGSDFDNLISRTSQQQLLKGKYNYADHGDYIDWLLPMHWESLGQPGFVKRFLRVTLWALETLAAASTQVILNSYIDYSRSKQVDANTLTWTSQDLAPVKVAGSVCRSRQFELKSQRYFEPFPLGGMEIEAVANFRPVMKR